MPTGLAVLLTAAPPSINGWPNDRAKRRERFIRDYLADDQPNFVTAAKFERIARTVSRYALRRGLRHAGASPHPYRRSHRWSHFPSKAAAKDQAEEWERVSSACPRRSGWRADFWRPLSRAATQSGQPPPRQPRSNSWETCEVGLRRGFHMEPPTRVADQPHSLVTLRP
jgi:hypothetical protein